MSVINQMLKDLDKRSRSPSKKLDASLTGVYRTSVERRKKTSHSIFAILAFIIITAFLISVPYLIQPRQNPSKIITGVSKVQTATLVAIKKNIADAPINFTTSNAIMTGITLQTQSDMTFLRFLLNGNVLYRVNADVAKNQLIIVLEHTRLLTSLPLINYANSAIEHIAMMNDPNGDLKIFITLNQDALLQHLEFNEASQFPELQIDFLKKNSIVNQQATNDLQPANAEPVKKLVVDMSVEQDYQRALSFAAQGQLDKAIQLLTAFVNKSPLYNPARQTLITLLLQENHRALAEKIVDMGLIQQPNFLPFIEFKAHILVDENKIAPALSLLERASPPLVDHPDYYGFIAALYQRQGHAKLATRLYEQLLMLQPTKGVWWVGLAIALDSEGKHSEAQEAYARAEVSQGLTPELRAYVETELHES